MIKLKLSYDQVLTLHKDIQKQLKQGVDLQDLNKRVSKHYYKTLQDKQLLNHFVRVPFSYILRVNEQDLKYIKQVFERQDNV